MDRNLASPKVRRALAQRKPNAVDGPDTAVPLQLRHFNVIAGTENGWHFSLVSNPCQQVDIMKRSGTPTAILHVIHKGHRPCALSVC